MLRFVLKISFTRKFASVHTSRTSCGIYTAATLASFVERFSTVSLWFWIFSLNRKLTGIDYQESDLSNQHALSTIWILNQKLIQSTWSLESNCSHSACQRLRSTICSPWTRNQVNCLRPSTVELHQKSVRKRSGLSRWFFQALQTTATIWPYRSEDLSVRSASGWSKRSTISLDFSTQKPWLVWWWIHRDWLIRYRSVIFLNITPKSRVAGTFGTDSSIWKQSL